MKKLSMKKLGLIATLLLLMWGNPYLAMGQDGGDHPIITPENAAQVTQLARLGDGTITASAWSSDAQTFVVATSLDIYIFNIGENEPQVLKDVGYTSYIALSDDGRFLAALQYAYPTVRLRAWNLATGEESVLTGWDASPPPFRFFPGSSRLITETRGGLTVWDLETSQLIKQVPIQFGGLPDMSPDMQRIIGFWKVTSTGAGWEYITISVWDGNTGELMSSDMVAEGPWVVDHAFNPAQNNLLAVLHGNGVVRLWDIETRQLLYALTLPHDLVSTIAFTADGRILATGGGGTDGKVRLWETATGALTDVFPNQPEDIQQLVFGPDGQLIAFYRDQHGARAWDARTGEVLASFTFPSTLLPMMFKVSFDPSGEQVIAVGMDGIIHVWDAVSGQKQAVWDKYQIPPGERWMTMAGYDVDLATTFSQDRKYLARLDRQTGALYLWDLARGSEPTILQTPADQGGNRLAFSGDNRWLIFGGEKLRDPGEQGAFSTWNLWAWGFEENMTPTRVSILLPNYNAWSYANTAFSPTEPVVSYMQDIQDQFGKARLYLHNVETGDVRAIADVRRVNSNLIFSPDGSLLALRQIDTLGFWNVHTGMLEYEFNVCGGSGPTIFSPDGSLVLVVCGLNTALYDARSGEKLNTLIGHTSYVWATAFNVEGSLVATASIDGTVRLWGIER